MSLSRYLASSFSNLYLTNKDLNCFHKDLNCFNLFPCKTQMFHILNHFHTTELHRDLCKCYKADFTNSALSHIFRPTFKNLQSTIILEQVHKRYSTLGTDILETSLDY
uniref:Uncharacterized protein n=1 Tax=Micrurus spixii TaxID=129469 RepID=A0A2D4MEN3_9SAUR